MILLLWLPAYITKTALGEELIAIREAFISREAGRRFLGYLDAQKAPLEGGRQALKNRPELVARYGYDTKFAMHAVRLGFEGIELLSRRCLTLPQAKPDLSTLRAVRTGQLSFADTLALIEEVRSRLARLVESCTWEADVGAINAFLVRAHAAHWRTQGGTEKSAAG